MQLFDVQLTLTKEEILDGMKRAKLRRASLTQLVIQTVVLLLVAGWCFVAFFAEGMQTAMSLVIGILALVLLLVMWIVPQWQMRAIAVSMVENGDSAHMWVFEDGLNFSADCPDGAYYDFGTFFCDRTEQSLVFRFANDEVIVVPRRLLTEENWQWLCEKTKGSVGTRRRRHF
ncbi:MAG: hypothetical protein ACI39E_01095 [Acutalibacteraceae bacterium]